MKYTFYKICCLDTNITDTYVGSTKNFRLRKWQHKQNSKNNNFKLYQFIRENGGWDNFNMIPIKEVECETKLQAIIIEEEIRCELKANLNSIKAYITEEQLIQRDKDYRIKNKDYICQQRKTFYETNKDRLKIEHKEWYEANKDELNAKRRKNYPLIKDKLSAWSKIKITCECGSHYTQHHKSRHIASLKHQSFLENKNHIV
jgi:hypothetical protein